MDTKFNQFFNQYNLKPVEKEDSTALDQCMDLAFAWCDALGIDRAAIRHEYAYQIWANPTDATRKYFDLIANNPNDTNKPSVGDIAVFKQTTGIPVGHVSIETGKSDGYNLISFDQNWDTPHYHYTDTKGNWIPYSRTVVHSKYYGVVGWLHPKVNLPKGDDALLNLVKAVIDAPGTPADKISKIRIVLKQ